MSLVSLSTDLDIHNYMKDDEWRRNYLSIENMGEVGRVRQKSIRQVPQNHSQFTVS
jgi:hypothetical protein